MKATQASPPAPRPKGSTRVTLGLALGIASWGLFTLVVIMGFAAIAGADEPTGLLRDLLLLISLITPLLALLSWLMTNSTLRRIRDGKIHSSAYHSAKKAKTLGIVGTFGQPSIVLAFAIVLSLLYAGRLSSPKDLIILDLNNLFANAIRYRVLPSSMGGGEGSYTGYVPLASLAKTSNGFYSARVLHSDTIQFIGKWINDSTVTISVKIGPDANAVEGSWIYRGVSQHD